MFKDYIKKVPIKVVKNNTNTKPVKKDNKNEQSCPKSKS